MAHIIIHSVLAPREDGMAEGMAEERAHACDSESREREREMSEPEKEINPPKLHLQ